MKCNASSTAGRRAFLKLSGLAALGAYLERAKGALGPTLSAPTHVLRIRVAQVELAPGRLITTTTYDGQLAGPLLRGVVGQPMRVDIYNHTGQAQRVNWHGQNPLAGEATYVPAHSMRRMELTPARAGLYFYHSDQVAAAHLDIGLYSGQAGPLLIEPARPHRRERESLVVLKDCEPFLRRTRRGCEVDYRSLTLNGRLPGQDFPQATGPVLLRILNLSPTRTHALELPGHSFEVVALDGNPVPRPTRVQTLQLSPGERICARAELPRHRDWIVREPDPAGWDYTRFGAEGQTRQPDETLDLVLTRHEAARSGFNRWSMNGANYSACSPKPLFLLQRGLRYRLRIRNSSDEIIPLHLQNHRLEIVRVADNPTARLLKDVVSIGAGESLEVDFLADSHGPALLYCTRQLHRDFGLMALLDYT